MSRRRDPRTEDGWSDAMTFFRMARPGGAVVSVLDTVASMGIAYTDEKCFSVEQTHRLFASVGWESANYPERLHKALMGSDTVFSAWDGDRLVGLARAIDDGEMLAYMHWVLVDPEYHGRGIGGHLVELIRERYQDYLFLEVMPEECRNAPFYQGHGFTLMEGAAAMQIVNRS